MENAHCGAGSSGGATETWLSGSNWDDFNSLKSRIMVAGAGGFARDYCGAESLVILGYSDVMHLIQILL